MPSKTLMIRRAVYDDLRKEKRRGESFSRVLERLLSKGHPLEGVYGLWEVRHARGHPRKRRSRPAPAERGSRL